MFKFIFCYLLNIKSVISRNHNRLLGKIYTFFFFNFVVEYL